MTTFSDFDPFADWWNTQGDPQVDGGPSTFTDNPFADYLETEPDIPYQGAVAKANLTPNQFQTFRNQRNTIFGQFQARLMEQFQQGQMPTERWTDFSGNFDFNKEFQRFAPGQRAGGGLGGGLGSFAAPVRFGRRVN